MHQDLQNSSHNDYSYNQPGSQDKYSSQMGSQHELSHYQQGQHHHHAVHQQHHDPQSHEEKIQSLQKLEEEVPRQEELQEHQQHQIADSIVRESQCPLHFQQEQKIEEEFRQAMPLPSTFDENANRLEEETGTNETESREQENQSLMSRNIKLQDIANLPRAMKDLVESMTKLIGGLSKNMITFSQINPVTNTITTFFNLCLHIVQDIEDYFQTCSPSLSELLESIHSNFDLLSLVPLDSDLLENLDYLKEEFSNSQAKLQHCMSLHSQSVQAFSVDELTTEKVLELIKAEEEQERAKSSLLSVQIEIGQQQLVPKQQGVWEKIFGSNRPVSDLQQNTRQEGSREKERQDLIKQRQEISQHLDSLANLKMYLTQELLPNMHSFLKMMNDLFHDILSAVSTIQSINQEDQGRVHDINSVLQTNAQTIQNHCVHLKSQLDIKKVEVQSIRTFAAHNI